MKYLVYIFIAIFPITLVSNESTQYTPLEVTKIVFDSAGFDYTKVLPFCCDMHEVNFRENSLGEMLPKNTIRNFEQIYIDSNHAITSVGLQLGNEFQDFYIYLKKIDSWHIEAVRTLAQVDLIKMQLMEIEKLPQDSAISFITKYGYTNLDKYINRIKLLISADKNIISYFNENSKEFNIAAQLIAEKYSVVSIENVRNINQDESVMSVLDNLLISNIVAAEEGEFIGFQIGGILDNTVGFFYQPEISKIPQISKDLYIVIKSLGNGWYFYKTT